LVEVKFRMLSVEELGDWVAKEAPQLEQDEINAVMTLCSYVSDFEQFLEDSPEANALFEEWLEIPSQVH
jgi:hypothetical protein